MSDESRFSWRAIAVSAVLGGTLGYALFARSHAPDATPRIITPRPGLYADEQMTVELFKTVSPSVVYINTFTGGPDVAGPAVVNTGSGFVWDNDGHIVTNLHVIGNSDTAIVHDNQGNKYNAKVIGVASENDLAVLKVTPTRTLQPIPLGTSADLQVGQKVYAIGNPFGLDRTLTTGVVSAVGRALPFAPTEAPIENVIQTDAAINPGNSGGPLLDSAGRLIGMNTAIQSPSQGNVGIGFAVPVDTVNQIVPQLIKGDRATLGLAVHNKLSEMFHERTGQSGAVVIGIVPGSAAAAAGIRPARPTPGGVALGDILVKIDDHDVNSSADVNVALSAHKPGDTVTLLVLRNGQQAAVKVMLDKSTKSRR